jgi:autotransporter-associated beta strand protein
VALVGLGTAQVALAQTTYSFLQPTTGTAGNMSTTANWAGGVTPVSGTSNVLSFTTLGANANSYTLTNDIGPLTMNSVRFTPYGTGTFTVALGSNALTLDGTSPSIVLNGQNNATISGTGGVVLNATTNVTGSGNGPLTISSIVSGAGGFDINQSANGVLNLTGANTYTGGTTLTNGTLQLGSATALGTGSLTINGGKVRFGTTGTIANNITANADMVIAGGFGAVSATSTPTLAGVISGAGGLSVRNYTSTGTTSGVVVQGANTFAGVTNVGTAVPQPFQSNVAPTLTVSGSSGALSNTSAVNVYQNATLSLTGTSTTANGNRLNDAAPVNLHGGRLSFAPGLAGTSETIGNVTISGNAHLNTTAAGLSSLIGGTFTRQGNATMWLDSTAFGTIQSATTATIVTFAGATPASMGVVSPGSGTGTETGLIPWMVGSSPTNPRGFVTYDAVGGLQYIPYNNATYVVQVSSGAVSNATVQNKNVHFNGAGTYTLSGVNTIGGFTSTSSTVTVTGGTLDVYGPIVNFDSLVFNNTNIDFGSRTGYIHNSWHNSFRGTGVITGSGGLVVANGATAKAFLLDNANPNTFTGGLTVNGNGAVGFFRDDQLGAAGGGITLSGGTLSYNAASNVTINRPIAIEQANGGFHFNQTNSNTGNTATAATSTTVATLSGTISGVGSFVKDGIGVVNLTGTNTYGGGTLVNAGTLQIATDANLGAAGTKLMLNGGTLNPLASLTLSRPIELLASSTINNADPLTLSGTLENTGVLHNTVLPTLTKAGAGTLTLSGDGSKLSGPLAVTAGNVTISGASGNIRGVTNTTVAAGASLTIDNTGSYSGDRIGDAAAITLSGAGAVVSYLAPSAATTDPAERMGVLRSTVAGGVFSVTGGAGSGTALRFTGLDATATLTIRGDQLGDVAFGTGTTRIFFDAFTTNIPILTNVFFASTAGTGTSTVAAGYDTVRGIVAFTPTPVSGTAINNFAPENVPTIAAYTATGDTTAATGAQIYSLILDGGSTLTLNGGNAAGPTNNNTPDGTLLIVSGLLTSQNGDKTVTSATPRTVSFGTAAGTITTTSNLTLDANVTLSATSGGLTKNGAGTLTLAAPFTTTGPLSVNAGTMSTTGALGTGTLSVASGATLNTGGGNLTTTGLNPGAGTINVGAGTVTVNTATNQTFDGVITGSGGLTKAGAGNQTIAAAQTYTGATAIQGGTLTLGTNNALPTASPITFGTAAGSSGFNLNLNGFNQTLGPITFVSPSTTTTAISIPAASTLTLGGDINFVNQTATPDNAFPVVIAGPGTIDLGGGVRNITIQANNNGSGDIQVGAPLINGGINYTGNPTPGGTVARLALNAVGSTYSGATTVNRGELRAGAASAFSPNSVLTLNAGTGNTATANLNGNNQTVGGLAGTSAGTNQVTLGAGNLTVDQASNTQFNGVISGTGQLIKSGAGTLDLTGTNTYTGATTVNAGALLVNGSTAAGSAVTVNGGTLGGSGTVNGTLTVNSGGTVAPGNSPGILTVNNNVTFASGSNFSVELNGTTAGTDYDQLTVNGTVDLGSSNLLLSLGFAPSVSDLFFVVNNDLAEAITGTFNGLSEGATVSATFSGTTYQGILSYVGDSATSSTSGGNDVVLSGFTALVPEPGSVALLALGGLGLIPVLRRRKR